MFQRLAESSPQDFARAVLLGLIAVSWTVVIGVGGWLIVKTYGDDVRDRPPLVEQTLSVLNVLEVSPPELREDILLTRDSNYFDVTLIPNQAPASPDNFAGSLSTFNLILPGLAAADRRDASFFDYVGILLGVRQTATPFTSLGLLLSDGTQVNYRLLDPFQRRDGLIQRLFYLFLVGSTIITLAMIGVFRLGNPMGRFKEAALRLSEDIESPPLDESRGVTEVRAVSRAMNGMQQRVKDYLAERTTMLAAISHDIRTGLFRLRMRSEKLEDPTERAKALEDADEMAAILDDMLTFARSDQNDVGFEKLSLPSLLTSICDNLEDQGKEASFESGGRMTIIGDRTSLKRGFLNLIENGTKYGLRSRVTTERTDDGRARVIIDDDGPGIPADQRDAVFQPFVRLEDSRNRKTGGTGLGLAIVKKVMDRHGADITLHGAPGGGLRVVVELDLA